MENIEELAGTAVGWLDWLPSWAASLIVLGVMVAVGLTAHAMMFRFLNRLVEEASLFWRSTVQRVRGPARLALLCLTLAVGASIAPLSYDQADMIRQGLVVAFIITLGWSAMTMLHIGGTIYSRGFSQAAADSVAARKVVTQIRILERAGALLIVIVTAAAALMTFPEVRQYGVSLLASAGAAGLIVGLALQPVLANLFAGIQLAVTQPIRIEDSIVVEGEWGWVEEITSTYVVVRIWDWRRLVLPLKYFIERPFQNWTREGGSIIGNVMLHVDYTAPVPLLRQKADELIRASALWDGQVVNLQVVEAFNETMQLRLLMSASTAGRAFDLRCEIREKMIAFLQQECPSALPRRRNETLTIQAQPATAAAAQSPPSPTARAQAATVDS